jgi:hypothetical protein
MMIRKPPDGQNDPDALDNADNDNTRTGTAIDHAPNTAAMSLESLGAIITATDTTGGYGSTSLPMLLYKSREGEYQIGQLRKIPEAGAHWLVNIASALHGYIGFDDNNRPTSKTVPAHMPMPNLADLPDLGFEWALQLAFTLMCLTGADKGLAAQFKSNTVGGAKAFNGLFDEVKRRWLSGEHDGKLFPIVELAQTSTQSQKFGKIPEPIFNIVGWSTAKGPEPESKSPPSPKSPTSSVAASEQPRRRSFG